MFAWMGRISLVVCVILLVIIGLNTSNQGINQVSGELRGPVVALGINRHEIHGDWLGKEYGLSWQRLKQLAAVWTQEAGKYYTDIKAKLP